jgi:hypothetical protein
VVRTGASGTGWPIDLAASQVRDRCLERSREPDQGAAGNRDRRAVLEVVEVAGIHPGTSRHLLMRQTQLLPPVRDALGEVAGASARHADESSSLDEPR